MFTEPTMHEHPTMIKAFMGIPAEVFWRMVSVASQVLPEVDRHRLERAERERTYGGGRRCDQPVVIRVAAVLTYLRLHAPQLVVAWMYGVTQTDLSRDVRRLLPAIQRALPCPKVWKVLESGQELSEADQVKLAELAGGARPGRRNRTAGFAGERPPETQGVLLGQEEAVYTQNPVCDRWRPSYPGHQ